MQMWQRGFTYIVNTMWTVWRPLDKSCKNPSQVSSVQHQAGLSRKPYPLRSSRLVWASMASSESSSSSSWTGHLMIISIRLLSQNSDLEKPVSLSGSTLIRLDPEHNGCQKWFMNRLKNMDWGRAEDLATDDPVTSPCVSGGRYSSAGKMDFLKHARKMCVMIPTFLTCLAEEQSTKDILNGRPMSTPCLSTFHWAGSDTGNFHMKAIHRKCRHFAKERRHHFVW